jgi:hypothetical protein
MHEAVKTLDRDENVAWTHMAHVVQMCVVLIDEFQIYNVCVSLSVSLVFVIVRLSHSE